MNRSLTAGLVFALSAIVSCAASAQVADQIDWPKFLSRQDLIWNRLPEKWGEGAFTGNGLMGAMVYLTDDKTALRFRVGRSDVEVQGQGQAYRLPIGDMVLVPVGKIVGGSMRMDLWNAEVIGTVKTDKGEIAFRTYTHTDQPLQIVEIKPTEGEIGCSWKFEPGVAVNPRTLKDLKGDASKIPADQKN